MIYVCAHCDRDMTDLKTDGDEVDHNLICASCSKDLLRLLKRAKEIQISLLYHFRKIL